MKGINPNKIHKYDTDTNEPSGILATIIAILMIGILVAAILEILGFL